MVLEELRPVRFNEHRPRARGTVSPSASANLISPNFGMSRSRQGRAIDARSRSIVESRHSARTGGVSGISHHESSRIFGILATSTSHWSARNRTPTPFPFPVACNYFSGTGRSLTTGPLTIGIAWTTGAFGTSILSTRLSDSL